METAYSDRLGVHLRCGRPEGIRAPGVVFSETPLLTWCAWSPWRHCWLPLHALTVHLFNPFAWLAYCWFVMVPSRVRHAHVSVLAAYAALPPEDEEGQDNEDDKNGEMKERSPDMARTRTRRRRDDEKGNHNKNESTRASIRNMYVPSDEDLDRIGSAAVFCIRRVARYMVLLPWVRRAGLSSTSDVQHILLVAQCNAHSMAEDSKLALFENGSKVSHSCMPNLQYHSMGAGNEDGRGVFRALRDILFRQPLTVNYLDGPDLCLPRVLRRGKLRERYFFECRCQRCVGPDEVRIFQCQNTDCSTTGHVRQVPHNGKHDNKHATTKTGSDDGDDDDDTWEWGNPGRWMCSSCSQHPNAADLEAMIRHEHDLVERLHRAEAIPASGGLLQWGQDKVLASVARVARDRLGARHWIVARIALLTGRKLIRDGMSHGDDIAAQYHCFTEGTRELAVFTTWHAEVLGHVCAAAAIPDVLLLCDTLCALGRMDEAAEHMRPYLFALMAVNGAGSTDVDRYRSLCGVPVYHTDAGAKDNGNHNDGDAHDS